MLPSENFLNVNFTTNSWYIFWLMVWTFTLVLTKLLSFFTAKNLFMEKSVVLHVLEELV